MARTIYKVETGTPVPSAPGAESLPSLPAGNAVGRTSPADLSQMAPWQPTAAGRILRRRLMWALISILVLIVIAIILIVALSASESVASGGAGAAQSIAAALAAGLAS